VARHYIKKEQITTNQYIRFPQVRVLNEQGEMIGVMSSYDALSEAKQQEKDLVLVTAEAEPPVVKIIELSKYKYQLQQKQAKARKKNRAQDIKEVRITMFIGEGDLASRKTKIRKFLEGGDKVRLSLMFKGRQITKKDFANKLFEKIINEIESEELGKLEMEPKIVGRKMIAQLTPA
jgi:translation initiation factor IF-3